MKLAVALVSLLLSGCVSSVTGSTYTDGRFWYSNTKSASDIAGGPRQDILIAVDSNGMVVANTVASGMGTLQTIVGAVNAIVTAGGNVAGDALVRPSRNSTTATINGGSGTSTVTSQSTTGSVNAVGGAGGAGGGGGSVSAP